MRSESASSVTNQFIKLYFKSGKGASDDHASVGRPISDKLKRQTETIAQALGAAITALRTQKNVSQDMIALKSGYSVQWINRLERGKANITMQVLVAMADIFKLRPSQLLARAERKQRKGQSKSGVATPKDKA